MEPLSGVYAILATPFLPDGALDDASLRRLTAATIDAGVDGLTVLGVAGEIHKLDDAERLRVLRTVLEVNDGRLPIIVGTSRESTHTAIAAARTARAEGVSGIMVAPPTFVQPGPALTAHLQRAGDASGLPIVLQDYPPREWSGALHTSHCRPGARGPADRRNQSGGSADSATHGASSRLNCRARRNRWRVRRSLFA